MQTFIEAVIGVLIIAGPAMIMWIIQRGW